MRRRGVALALALATGLAAAAVASAHVIVATPRVAPGVAQAVTFEFFGDRADAEVVAARVDVPRGATLLDVVAPHGWKAHQIGRSAVWDGGRLEPLASGLFTICVSLPPGRGLVHRFETEQTYGDAALGEFPVSVFATQAEGRPCPRTGEGGGVPVEAIAGGVVGGLIVATVGVLVLAQRRRGRAASA